MHRSSTYKLLPFDMKIERTLFKLKKVKADNIGMEDQNSETCSEGHSD